MPFLILFLLAGNLVAQSSVSVALVQSEFLTRDVDAFPLANAERQAHMRKLFEAAHCPEIHEVPLGKKPVPATIVCVWPGSQPEAIVVGAHFDKVEKGEGKIDNATGSVLLPHLMRALHSSPKQHTFIYCAFAEEEQGLLGSKALVKKGLPGREKELFSQSIKAMINIDSVATGNTAIALSNSDQWLAAIARSIASALKVPLDFINVDQVGRSDGASFAAKGVPSIEFHSLTNETFPILHTERDTMKEFKADHYSDTYRLIAFYLAHLDTAILSRPVKKK
jgi:Zn-dependent M28 family amino/carboxypeptidase